MQDIREKLTEGNSIGSGKFILHRDSQNKSRRLYSAHDAG